MGIMDPQRLFYHLLTHRFFPICPAVFVEDLPVFPEFGPLSYGEANSSRIEHELGTEKLGTPGMPHAIRLALKKSFHWTVRIVHVRPEAGRGSRLNPIKRL